MSGERVKLTKAQRRVLQMAVDDGGSFEASGVDARTVRGDLLMRLRSYGFLVWRVGGYDLGGHHPIYAITDAGRAALAGDRP